MLLCPAPQCPTLCRWTCYQKRAGLCHTGPSVHRCLRGGGGGVVESPELCSDMSTSTSRFSPLKPLGSPVFWVIRSHMRGVNIRVPIVLACVCVAVWFGLPAGSYSTSDCVGFRDLLSAGGGDLGRCSAHRFGGRPVIRDRTAGLSVPILSRGPEACRFRMGIQRMACISCSFIILGFWSSSEHRSQPDSSTVRRRSGSISWARNK